MSKKNNKENNVLHFRGVMEQKWEDLDPLYDASVSSLRDVATEIQRSLLILLSHAETQSDKEVQLLSKSFQKDLRELTNKIIALELRHKDKKGLIKTENELAEYLSIGQEYSIIANMTTTVLFNTAIEMESKLMELKEIISKKEQNTSENLVKEEANGE